MNKLCTTILLFTAVLGFTTQAFAATSEYDFEIIIFEDTSGKYRDAEQWPEWSTDSLASDSRSSTAASRSSKNITPISSLGLDKYVEALRRSSRYNVLVHKSWRQAGLNENTAVSIPIDSRDGRSAAMQGKPEKSNIHGEIKLVLGRYLHLYTDLVYQQPRAQQLAEWQTADFSPYKNYPIRFHRKMRSKQLHYIDHPLVGILVMAMPVKETE